MSERTEDEKTILESYERHRFDKDLGVVDDSYLKPLTVLTKSEGEISESERGGTFLKTVLKTQEVEPIHIKDGVEFEGQIDRCTTNPLEYLGKSFAQKEAETISNILIEKAMNAVKVDGDLNDKIINEGQDKIGWISDTFIVSRSQITELIRSGDLVLPHRNGLTEKDVISSGPRLAVVGELTAIPISLPEGILGEIHQRINIQIAKTVPRIIMASEDNKTTFIMEEWCSVAPAETKRTLKFVEKK